MSQVNGSKGRTFCPHRLDLEPLISLGPRFFFTYLLPHSAHFTRPLLDAASINATGEHSHHLVPHASAKRRNKNGPGYPETSLPKIDSVAKKAQPENISHQGPGSRVGVGGGGERCRCPGALLEAPTALWTCLGADGTLTQLEKVLLAGRLGWYLQNSTAGSQAGEWPL